MGTTVLDLLLGPELCEWYPIAGWQGLGRAVSRVAVAEVPDAHQFLVGGELVVSTAYWTREDPEAAARWLTAVMRTGAAAVAVKFHRFLGQVPPALVAQADALGVPLIAVDGTTGWAPQVEAIHRRLQQSGAGAQPQSEALRQWLHTGCGLPEALAGIAEATGLPLALCDRRLAPLYATARLPLLSPGAGALCEPGAGASCTLAAGGERLTLAPIRRRGSAVGWLVAGGEAAEALPQLLGWARCLEIALPCLCPVRQPALPDGPAPGVAAAEGELCAVLVVELDADDGALVPLLGSALVAEQLSHEPVLCQQGVTLLPTERGYAAVVPIPPGLAFAPSACRRSLRAVAEALGAALARWYPPAWLQAGVSRIKAPERWHEALAEATTAAQARGEEGGLRFYEEIGLYRLLSSLGDRAAIGAYCDVYLRPLAEFDQRKGGSLVQTLEMHFALDGNPVATARALHIHRNTLHYRLEQIRKLTGLNLRSLQSQLELYLAVKMRSIIG